MIGGDKVHSLKEVLYNMGAKNVAHWEARKVHTTSKKIPDSIDAVVMLTDFLNHNAMTIFKKEAKKRKIPLVCTKRGVGAVANSCQRLFCGECKGCN